MSKDEDLEEVVEDLIEEDLSEEIGKLLVQKKKRVLDPGLVKKYREDVLRQLRRLNVR